MAFFKLRKAAGESPSPAPAPESVDALRRRARYRLAGAAILVLAAVVGFPLLFDNQPRPIAVDIPIDIPDKAHVKPLPVSPALPANQATASAPEAPPALPKDAPKVAAKDAPRDAGGDSAKETKPAPKEASREQAKEEVIIAAAKPAEVASPADKAAATGRFIVQFGAFSDSARAHEARVKVEKTGLKTYAQVVDGADGKKFRVRVGPFEKRADAEKAAEKIKKLDLPAAILGL